MNEPTDKSLEQRLRDGLRASVRSGFAPGFEDRALLRWKAERTALVSPNTISLIEYRARRLLPLAAAASLILAVYSARVGNFSIGANQGNVIARALGWSSSVTPSRSADLFESVYGLPQTESTIGGN